MITLTEQAHKHILLAMEDEERKDLAVRVAIIGRGGGGFQYSMDLVGEEEREADDLLVEQGDLKIYIDSDSAPNLEGATIDFVRRLEESGFKFDNPNSPWDDPVAAEVARVIDSEINPNIAAHGGFVTLLNVEDGTAFIAMGGGCQGCGMASVTLSQMVEGMIRDAVPQITEVRDRTDHAAGTNPYY